MLNNKAKSLNYSLDRTIFLRIVGWAELKAGFQNKGPHFSLWCMLQSIPNLFFLKFFVCPQHTAILRSSWLSSFEDEPTLHSTDQLVMATNPWPETNSSASGKQSLPWCQTKFLSSCSAGSLDMSKQVTPLLETLPLTLGLRALSSPASHITCTCTGITRGDRAWNGFVFFFLRKPRGNCPYLTGNWKTGILVGFFWFTILQMFTK